MLEKSQGPGDAVVSPFEFSLSSLARGRIGLDQLFHYARWNEAERSGAGHKVLPERLPHGSHEVLILL
jgi:hypothetical protein